jgi:hypothetical protein
LLSAAVLCFLAGLIAFVIQSQVKAFASSATLISYHFQKSKVATYIVVGFSAFCAVGLSFISLWFVYEKIKDQLERKKWKRQNLAIDVLAQEPLREKIIYFFREARSIVSDIWEKIYETMSGATSEEEDPEAARDVEMQVHANGAPRDGDRWKMVAESFGQKQAMIPSRLPAIMRQHNWQRSLARIGRGGFVRTLTDNSPSLKGNSFRHAHFSPDGKWLAAISKAGCFIFKTETILKHANSAKDVHPMQSLMKKRDDVRQAEWSPNGKMLLTRSARTLKIWMWNDEVGPDVNVRCIFL